MRSHLLRSVVDRSEGLTELPDYLVSALRAWHALAVQHDPGRPVPALLERAQRAWQGVNDACVRWEAEGRAARGESEGAVSTHDGQPGQG